MNLCLINACWGKAFLAWLTMSHFPGRHFHWRTQAQGSQVFVSCITLIWQLFDSQLEEHTSSWTLGMGGDDCWWAPKAGACLHGCQSCKSFPDLLAIRSSRVSTASWERQASRALLQSLKHLLLQHTVDGEAGQRSVLVNSSVDEWSLIAHKSGTLSFCLFADNSVLIQLLLSLGCSPTYSTHS